MTMQAIRELLHYSYLILSFARRDVRARYKQTALGAAWAVLQPLSLMIVFTLVFDRVARIPTGGTPYPIFSYSALIFWSFFSTAMNQGTLAMTANSNLVRKIYFPRETLLLAVLLSASLDLVIACSMLAVLMVVFKVSVTWTVLWVPVLLVVQVLFTFALVCLTSAVHVYFRDIGHALTLGLQLWMFATPVAYPMSVVPEAVRPLYVLNPMAPLIDGYRRAIVYGESPDLARIGIVLVVVLVLMSFTYLGFKRAERTFADVI
ncbi:MAG TPA: ABC transporter permease [Verrucomicrobiae bacterium]|jgi:ABC-type polysaccharide/polyol phosphate export permease|nr:ABC transporter permease [Verrucomicrobiae bacterium]